MKSFIRGSSTRIIIHNMSSSYQISVDIKEDYFWSKHSSSKHELWIKGVLYSHTMDELNNVLESLDISYVDNFVKSLHGHFALVVRKCDYSFIAVDRIRSTPLYFIETVSGILIDADPKKLVGGLYFNRSAVNADSILEISMAGFTIGNKTIFYDLHALKAGEYVIFKSDKYHYSQYYKYFSKIVDTSYEHLFKELSSITIDVFSRTLEKIGDRQIVVPLSAGNDSRLVASMFKYLGAKNVLCYSYGTKGNFEADTAKEVARRLGYKWVFVPLRHSGEKYFYASDEYKDYLEYSETFCSVPYVQGLSSVKYLNEMNQLDHDAVFVSGNSGDFISGGHICNSMSNSNNLERQKSYKEVITNNLISKHFSLWGYLKSEHNIKRIENQLWQEISEIHNNMPGFQNHSLYEYSEYLGRQSKYVITGQRVYEFYNYEWFLPLWDDQYLDFWRKVPVEYKIQQKLYKDMLRENNFCLVWGRDMPLNEKTITPKWIIPLRFIAKIPFAVFGQRGRKAWKRFDRSVFNYWMINTHKMKAYEYKRVLLDYYKEPRGIDVCWLVEDYLLKHGLKNN